MCDDNIAAQLIAPLPVAAAESFMPFGGQGAAPAPLAGPVAEIVVPAAAGPRKISLRVLRAVE